MAGALTKILLVTDDPVIPRLLAAFFKDVTLITAYDALQASMALREHPDVRLVVVDPDIAGAALLSHFQTALPGVAQVHLARSAPSATAASGTGSTVRTLHRPFREHELIDSVAQALSAARPPDPLLQPATPEAQRLEKRTEELEELSRRKDQLVLIAAHDIRAPLSVILGYVDILLGTEPALTEGGRTVLERIQASAHRLLVMLNNTLNLAALEEGKLGLTLAPCRVSQLVQEVLENLSGMIEEKHLVCTTEFQGDQQLYDLDGVKVQQVLQNLVSNAAKFNREHGAIHVGVRAAPQLIEFRVRDAGMGMTPEQVERAFTRFARFSPSAAQGSGLGLAIARGIVRLHGGSIWLETEPDKGSTFIFTVVPGHRPAKASTILG